MSDSVLGDHVALIADDLLLLLLGDGSGRPVVNGSERDTAIAGAVMLELIGSGKVEITGSEEAPERIEIVVVDRSTTGDEVLDQALSRLPEKPVKLRKAVQRSAASDRDAVLKRMIRKGKISREDMSLFGVTRVRSWPPAYGKHVETFAERLREVLVDGDEPEERTALLVELLWASGATHAVVGGDRARVERRAARIAERDWSGSAVGLSIRGVRSVMVAAIAAAGGAAAGG
ncbi:GOLPH3/VPS74 family protein [Actinopolyspora mortivallis]|uniref:GPP34 family phosphoprotein n=1 Tax=Actinopolyspora mortivallis TaxID=33906 RepID=A0A2T0GSE5_ACTMO|nr:GPP34 family phosphoprotein [Actinopolyspora mortivallis]PRW62036.1 hypothetical protein CEP50_17495 [Actinopolyspora mortivallis]